MWLAFIVLRHLKLGNRSLCDTISDLTAFQPSIPAHRPVSVRPHSFLDGTPLLLLHDPTPDWLSWLMPLTLIAKVVAVRCLSVFSQQGSG